MKIRLLTSMAGDAESYQYGDIIDKDEAIARGWIEAGLAELPKSEQVLQADVVYAERIAEEAMQQAEAAATQRDEIAIERDTLKEQVSALAEAAGDGADAAKEVGELRARVANLEKQLSERETQLGRVREDIRAEFEAKTPASGIDTEAMANTLAEAKISLNSAVAPAG